MTYKALSRPLHPSGSNEINDGSSLGHPRRLRYYLVCNPWLGSVRLGKGREYLRKRADKLYRGGKRGQPHQHVAHVAHAGVADDVLEVPLREGGQSYNFV